MRPRFVVVSGTHVAANATCWDRKLNPRAAIVLTRWRDTFKLRGYRDLPVYYSHDTFRIPPGDLVLIIRDLRVAECKDGPLEYPSCPECSDRGPHRLRHSSEHVELWNCGFCGIDFPIAIATMEPAGEGAPGQGPGTVATSDDCTVGPGSCTAPPRGAITSHPV